MGDDRLYNGPVNRCIYCGATGVPLSREHTLPRSLGGIDRFVIQKASCSDCADITSKFETHVSRELFGAVRAKHLMPTNHKNDRPTSMPLLVKKGDKEEQIDVSIEDYPALVPLLLFEPPTHVDKRPFRPGISVIGTTLSGPPIQKVQEALRIDGFTVTVSFKAVDFARLIAKIAYGYAIINFGPALIDTAYVRQTILKQVDDVGRWVGCIGNQPPPRSNNIHELRALTVDGDIHVYVRLFANYETPEYCTVVGRLPESGKCRFWSRLLPGVRKVWPWKKS